MSNCKMCGYDARTIVTSRWQITLPISYPSQNIIKGNRQQYNKYRSFRRHIEALMLTELDQVHIPVADRARRGLLTRWWGKRKSTYDHENLVGGGKPILDVMKKLGLIVDDNPKWWQGYYKQRKSPDGKDYITIELEELEGVKNFEPQ